MKICFYGVGGVGGYYGAVIGQKFGAVHDIYFVARGKHKEAICKNGLSLKRIGSGEVVNVVPKLCTDSVNDIPVCDIVILSVKSYDLDGAAKDLLKITNDNAIILPLLNGVDIYDRLRKHLHTQIILPSCVYIGTHIESPGVISQNGKNSKILIGRDPVHPAYKPDLLIDILRESGVYFTWEENVEVAIWIKYMLIASYALVTAAFDRTMGEVAKDTEMGGITKSIMTEIETIAHRLNVDLESGIVESTFAKALQFPHDTKTSFQRDVETKGDKNEMDIYSGTIMRLGKELGVDTPVTESMRDKVMLKF